MPFTCDTCGRMYTNKRNLCRHIKEKHNDGLLHFKCTVPKCKSEFIRRSYLTKHLTNIHKLDKKEAKAAATDVILEPGRVPLTETGRYSPISDVPSDDAHPLQEASEGDFEKWLDDFMQQPKSPLRENTTATATVGSGAAATETSCAATAEESIEGSIDAVATDGSIDAAAEGSVDAAEGSIDAAAEEPVLSFHAEQTLNELYDKVEEELRRQDKSYENSDHEQSVISNANDESAVDIDSIYISSDEETVIEDRVEYFNATLRTTTRIINGNIDSVDRVASVAYSNNFHPQNQDPMEVFMRIQQEFVNYMNSYNQN